MRKIKSIKNARLADNIEYAIKLAWKGHARKLLIQISVTQTRKKCFFFAERDISIYKMFPTETVKHFKMKAFTRKL